MRNKKRKNRVTSTRLKIPSPRSEEEISLSSFNDMKGSTLEPSKYIAIAEAEALKNLKTVKTEGGEEGESKKKLSLFCSVKELAPLGTGNAHYFHYAFWIPFIYLIMGLVSMYSFRSNLSEHKEDLPFLVKGGLVECDGKPPIQVAIVATICFFVFLAFLVLYRWRSTVTNKEMSTSTSNVANYSVLVSNFGHDVDEEEIREFFSAFGAVIEVLMVPYQTESILGYEKRIEKLENQIERSEIRFIKGESEPCMMCQPAPDAIRNEAGVLMLSMEMAKQDPASVGVAIVTFEDQESVKKSILHFSNTVSCCGPCYRGPKMNEHRVSVEPAPEHSDIIYSNVGYGFWSRVWRGMLIGFLWLLLLLPLLAVVIYPLKSDTESHFATICIHALRSFAVLWIKNVVTLIVTATIGFTKPETYSVVNVYLVGVLCVLHQLTTVTSISIAGDLTAVTHAAIITLLEFAFLDPALEMLRPLHFIKKRFSMWRAVTQKDLNECYEEAEFNLPERYANSYIIQFLAMLYGVVHPVTFFLAAIGLGLSYIIDKYQYLRICSKSPRTDDSLYNESFKVMVCLLLAFSISCEFHGIWANCLVCGYSVRIVSVGVLAYILVVLTISTLANIGILKIRRFHQETKGLISGEGEYKVPFKDMDQL